MYSAYSFFLLFFLSLYTARPSFEYYRQVYFVHSGLYKLVSKKIFNPFKSNGFSHCHQWNQSISVLRVVGWSSSF